MKNPNDSVLLELEFCSSNCNDTFEKLRNYWNYECKNFDINVFGKTLFEGLETIYKLNNISISEFGSRCYALWNALPSNVKEKEPFLTLSYADDCLYYGDEKQTRELYESTFGFYNE